MRKISLLVVLITMVLFSCVDDKESAVVEQIRTAKTAWLQAQAEMMKAQGEAQKILAETEKLKAENDAKNESARIEIERLKAEAEAAKTEAEADRIRAEIEKINQELEQARIEFEYQQQLNELSYQVAQAQAAYKKQQFINKLNEAIIAGKLNPELEKVYDEYIKALKDLRDNENQIASNEAQINWCKEFIENNFDNYIADFQRIIEDNQEVVNDAKEMIANYEAVKGATGEAVDQKIKELEAEVTTLMATLDKETANMLNSLEDAQKLIAERKKARKAYNNAQNVTSKAEESYNNAKEAYDEAQKGNGLKEEIVTGFNVEYYTFDAAGEEVGPFYSQWYAFPEFEQGIMTQIDIEKSKLAEDVKTKASAKTKAEDALAKAKKDLPGLNEKLQKAIAALKPLEEKNKVEKANLEKATKDKTMYESKVSVLETAKNVAQSESDAKEALVKTYTDELKDPNITPAKKAELEALLAVAKDNAAKAKTELEEATKNWKANDDALKAAIAAVDAANKAIADNATAYANAQNQVTTLTNQYNQAVADLSAYAPKGQLVLDVENTTFAWEKAKALEEAFNTKIEAATKDVATLLEEMNLAKAEWDAAIEAEASAQEALNAAKTAYDESDFAKSKKAAKKAQKDLEDANELILDYKSIHIQGESIEIINEKIKEQNEIIETATERITKAEQAIKEFNALTSDEEKNEELDAWIKRQNELCQIEIDNLNREISTLKEIQPDLQARVDRLQAAINAAEDALAE